METVMANLIKILVLFVAINTINGNPLASKYRDTEVLNQSNLVSHNIQKRSLNVENFLNFYYELMDVVEEFFDGCKCQDFSCECCAEINLEELYLKTEICTRVSFTPYPLTMALEVKVDNTKIISKKFSMNPFLPYCISGIIDNVKVCLAHHKIKSKNDKESCFDLEVRIFGSTFRLWRIGCIKNNYRNMIEKSYQNQKSKKSRPT